MSLLLFLLLVGIVAYWALQLLAPRPTIAPSGSIGDSGTALNLTPATLLFGSRDAAAPAAQAAPSNIQVNGIVEAGPNGVAILTVDGRPAAAYAVDQPVNDNTRVKSVELDKVVLDQRGKLLELKAPERGSVAVLSSGVGKTRDGSAAAPSNPAAGRNPAPPLPLPPATPTGDASGGPSRPRSAGPAFTMPPSAAGQPGAAAAAAAGAQAASGSNPAIGQPPAAQSQPGQPSFPLPSVPPPSQAEPGAPTLQANQPPGQRVN
ncbi:MAG: type II secretion system protein N [Lautropia sp.]